MLDRPKKLKAELQDWKCLMVVALWKDQVLTYQILHEGETMDSVKYLDFLENKVLPIVIAKKFGRPYILHDNARPHKHRIIMEFFKIKDGRNSITPHTALICHHRTWMVYIV
jgi:hypothetical protein